MTPSANHLPSLINPDTYLTVQMGGDSCNNHPLVMLHLHSETIGVLTFILNAQLNITQRWSAFRRRRHLT